jgi:hypothetical protein
VITLGNSGVSRIYGYTISGQWVLNCLRTVTSSAAFCEFPMFSMNCLINSRIRPNYGSVIPVSHYKIYSPGTASSSEFRTCFI